MGLPVEKSGAVLRTRQARGMDTRGLEDLLAPQDRVVTTAQLLALGATEPWIGRRIRDGRWQRVHRGVLVTYSGPVSWRSRFRAAVLHAGTGAVLSHEAAAYLHSWRSAPPTVVAVTVPADRHPEPSPGLRVVRSRLIRPDLAPLSGAVPSGVWAFPRTSSADTAFDLGALDPTPDGIVAALAEAARGRTPIEELRRALERRPTHPGRALFAEMLALVAEGVESPLELRYHQAERRHGLPRARLQVRTVVDGRLVRADCRYDDFGLRVELDGELAHPGGRTDQDTWRDNAVLIETGDLTLRYRWLHLAATPCDSTRQVALALRSRGWTGVPTRCGPDCTIRGTPPRT